jgi:hypothetical protein
MTSLHCEVWGGFFFSVASGKTSCHVACPVTLTPKLKNRYHPLVVILFVLVDKKYMENLVNVH